MVEPPQTYQRHESEREQQIANLKQQNLLPFFTVDQLLQKGKRHMKRNHLLLYCQYGRTDRLPLRTLGG